MLTEATWLDVGRAVVVLLLAVGQVLMAYWPELRRWPHTIASRSAALSTAVVPAGWAFAIWGIIFLWCFAFAVWHAFPSNLADPLLRIVGWMGAAVFAATILWEWIVPRRGLGWVSVAIIVTELTILLALTFVVLDFGPLDGPSVWVVAAPFLLYAGWTSAATFVNISSTAKGKGFDPLRLGETASAALLIFGAAATGATVAWFTGSWLYAGAVAWALFGIAVANARGGARLVLAVALFGMCVVLGSGLLSPNNRWLPA